MPGDPLSLWKDGEAKETILRFVVATTTDGGPDYVAPAERIAVFDNDGTLWVEQPMYTQLRFLLDSFVAMAPEHPEWAEQPPLKAALEGDLAALAGYGEHGLGAIAMATLAGKTTEEVQAESLAWIGSARHPRFDRLYSELIFRPQLQLLEFLRGHGYRTFIVSGGGVEFMRAFAEETYGIPPEQVIGSSVVTEYQVRGGRSVLVMRPQMNFVDDGPGKPVGINHFIGQRPIIAVGNSDGDFEMLEYTTTGDGPRLGLYVHHDDPEREYAYDRESTFGRLDRGLDEAAARRWVVVSMKNDWSRVFAHEA
jgi:phosphoglycolate phosphatase-like HAD superfamily hydrolase